MLYNEQSVKDTLETLHTEKTQRKNKRIVFLVKTILILFLSAAVCSLIIGISFVRSAVANAPGLDSLNAQPQGYASHIYDSDGNIMQTLIMEGSNREEASYDDFPDDLINAVVAIEDERFWQHNGVDTKGIIRAAFIGLTSGHFSEGASTITQQLIKNNVLEGGFEKSFTAKLNRKIQEQYLALKLERQLKKNIILEYYLNTINLGSNCLGVQVASQKYFGKDVSELSLSECTVLAAITSNPSVYNPITHPEKNQTRRQIVLQKMLDLGKITKDDYTDALNDPVYARIQSASSSSSERNQTFSYFTDAVYNEVSNDLQTKLGYTASQAYHLIYSGGLEIYTTMDKRIQRILDEEVNDPANYYSNTGAPLEEYSLNYSLKVTHPDGSESSYNEKDLTSYYKSILNQPTFNNIYSTRDDMNEALDRFREYAVQEDDVITSESIIPVLEPQASGIIIDQYNGYVLAVSGGRGEKTGSLTLNRATDSVRQPGSCFKVLGVFAPALDSCGATLATTYYDSAYSVNNQQILNWWGTQYLGYCNIRQGITYSMNIVATKCLVNLVTPSLGYSYLSGFGISTLTDNDKVPALALGGITYGVYNEQLTAAYAAIANDGVYEKPVYYTRVLDRQGNVILENIPENKRVIKSSTAALLTDAMKDVISSSSTQFYQYGISPTGAVCKVDGLTLAGKSGSTTNSNDLWFVGYSPYYTLGIWSGYDESKSLGASTDYHKAMWQKIMTRIHEGLPDKDFTFTDDLETAVICSKSGLLAVDGVCNCSSSNSDVYIEKFAPGTAPTEYCDRHYTLWICSDSGKSATEFCPADHVIQKVFLKIDDNDLLSGSTLDSTQIAPSNLQSCDIHTPK